MTPESNTKLIGAFVLGAVLLAVGAVLLFGSGRFLTQLPRYVLYFEGSVKGLSVGAPVMFRGVRIGSVAEIQLIADPDSLVLKIPVIVEIRPGTLKLTHGRLRSQGDYEEYHRQEFINRLISRGLRAGMVIQSFVTGQLMIELDFHPDAPLNLAGTDGELLEIPTIASGLGKLVQEIDRIPLAEVVTKVTDAIYTIEGKLNSPEFGQTIVLLNRLLTHLDETVLDLGKWVATLGPGIDGTLRDTRSLVRGLDRQVAELAPDTRSALGEIRSAVDRTLEVLDGLDRAVAPLAREVHTTLDSARGAMDSTRQSMDQASPLLTHLGEMTAPQNELRFDLTRALREIAAAGRALRLLSETLERHPEALLQGKNSRPGERD